MFSVVAHVRANGSCPDEELRELVKRSGDRGSLAKLGALVDQLRERGFQLLSTNKMKRISGELCELRPGTYRVFCYWDEAGQEFILLNGFRKASRRTPPSEIQRARNLMEEHRRQRKG